MSAPARLAHAALCALAGSALVWGARPAWAQGDELDFGEPANETEAVAKLPWRGTLVEWGHHVTKNTFDEGAQLSYNPTYVQNLTLAPRWYFSDQLSVRARQDFLLELTEPDVSQQRLGALDTVLDLVYGQKLPLWDLVLQAGGRAKLPISIASRAARRIAGLGARLDLGRDFEVLHGLSVLGLGRYVHYFATSNVVASEDRLDCALADRERVGLSTFYCGGGATTTSDEFSTTLEVELALLRDLTVGASFGWLWELGGPLDELAEVPLATGTESFEIEGRTRFRTSTAASLSVSYLVASWAELGVGGSTTTSQLDPDGSRRNPLFGPETEAVLSLTLLLDELYLAAR